MRKLSEIKGEDALDVLADVLEPFSEITSDQKFVEYVRTGKKTKLQIAGYLLKNHKKPIIDILTIISGEEVNDYGMPKIITMVVDLINDPELLSLFISQDTVTSSGSATENTEETEAE